MIGNRLREARTARHLSLNDVASRAKVSVATLSRIERDKQGLDLGLFLALCRILKTTAQELIGSEPDDLIDPLAVRIAGLSNVERTRLWQELAKARRMNIARRMTNHGLDEQVQELLAQIEFLHSEIVAVQGRIRHREVGRASARRTD
jgi:transcriptional regulator with XRE-family HTH domain